MLNYHYSYFVGSLIFAAAWAIFYLVGKNYRAQMLWGTVLSTPFALTGFLFIPQYWCPPSLFDLDRRFGISIEDILWSAAVGGIASVVSELLSGDRLVLIRGRRLAPRYEPLILVAAIFVVLEIFMPQRSMYNMIYAFLFGAVSIAYYRRDLIVHMINGGIIFGLCYLGLFAYFLVLYRDFIDKYYNKANLLGLYILRVPVEEIAFAVSGGLMWCVIYEYMQNYRLKSLRSMSFEKV
jgi:hypothetical protein